MSFKSKRIRKTIQAILIMLLLFMSTGCKEENEETEPVVDNQEQQNTQNPVEETPEPQIEKRISIEAIDEGDVIFYSSEGFYRYGPSIMKYDDGSMDAWFSSPGNSSSEWDWITYRHSDDGVNWSEEEIVLRPTPGSKDQCSVCDPGVIFFGGYYYLGYTSTADRNAQGANNSAFVARSIYPDGPFEKWNGSGWGGDPEPIILYEGDPSGWGIGELSFVIKDEDLCIYYTFFDENYGYTGLCKADLEEDWPARIRYKNDVLERVHQDSIDVVYDDSLDTYLAFAIDNRMTESSCLIMYASHSGKQFDKIDSTKTNIQDYAHNMGIAKSPEGHINSDEIQLIGYAYGKQWGRWNTLFQQIMIRK